MEVYNVSINRIHDDGSVEALGEMEGVDLDGMLEAVNFHVRTAPVGWAFDLTITKEAEAT